MQLATCLASPGVRTIGSRLGFPGIAAPGFMALAPQETRHNLELNLSRIPRPRRTKIEEASTDNHYSHPSETTADPSEKWNEIRVEVLRDARHATHMVELISDTTEFVKTISESIKIGGRRVSLVEVGCGTGAFVRSVADDFRTVVGVDLNKEFIDFCKDHAVPKNMAKAHYLQGESHYLHGDACHLYDLLKSKFPKFAKRGSRRIEFWDDTRVVACIGNSIGTIPEELRPSVYRQMAEVAGSGGVLVMVYWNAQWFGDACLNFYHTKRKLCGPLEGESVDFKGATLTTPVDYETKSTSVDEARDVMKGLGLEIIALKEKGKGIFVAARKS